jgi:hypothetical protein
MDAQEPTKNPEIHLQRDTTYFIPKVTTVAPPLPKDDTPKDFKVLLAYPNYSRDSSRCTAR